MITPNSPLKDNIELEKDIIDILYTNINCVNTIYAAYNSTKISNNDSFVIVFAIKFLEITILEHLHIKYGNFKATILNNSKINYSLHIFTSQFLQHEHLFLFILYSIIVRVISNARNI